MTASRQRNPLHSYFCGGGRPIEKASSPKTMFSGSTDIYVQRIPFLFENVVAGAAGDIKEPLKNLDYPDGDVFQVLHDRFGEIRPILEKRGMYRVVKKAFLETASVQHRTQELVVQAMDSRMDANDSQDSRTSLHRVCGNAGMDEIAQCTLLRISVSERSDHAHVSLYRDTKAHA